MEATSTTPAAQTVNASRWRWTGPLAAALVGLAFGAAACGGGGHPNAAVAHVGKSTSTDRRTDWTSQCFQPELPEIGRVLAMHAQERSAGLPGPNIQGDYFINGRNGVDPNSPTFQAAQKSCKALAPKAPRAAQSSSFLAQALKFSQCMRSNGVPNFPGQRKVAAGWP